MEIIEFLFKDTDVGVGAILAAILIYTVRANRDTDKEQNALQASLITIITGLSNSIGDLRKAIEVFVVRSETHKEEILKQVGIASLSITNHDIWAHDESKKQGEQLDALRAGQVTTNAQGKQILTILEPVQTELKQTHTLVKELSDATSKSKDEIIAELRDVRLEIAGHMLGFGEITKKIDAIERSFHKENAGGDVINIVPSPSKEAA